MQEYIQLMWLKFRAGIYFFVFENNQMRAVKKVVVK